MASATLALSAVTYLVAAASFAGVARALLLRPRTGIPRDVTLAFPTWWACLAVYMALHGSLTLAAGLGWASVPVWLASRYVAIPALCFGSAALTYHVAYIYTGSRAMRAPLAAFYAAVCAIFFYVTFVGDAVLNVGPWLAEVRSDFPHPGLQRFVFVGVGLPPIVGSVMLLYSSRRVADALDRRRIRLVASSILLWVGSGLVARLSGDGLYAFVTLTLFGLASALAVHVAYRTPDDEDREQRRRALAERVQHLV